MDSLFFLVMGWFAALCSSIVWTLWVRGTRYRDNWFGVATWVLFALLTVILVRIMGMNRGWW